MDNKEAIAVLKSNYPHGRIMLSEAVDLSIKALEAMELVPTPNKQMVAALDDIRAVVFGRGDSVTKVLKVQDITTRLNTTKA